MTPRITKDQLADPEWRKTMWNRWRNLINMTQAEIDAWALNPWRKRASLSAQRAAAARVYSGLRSLKNIQRKRSLHFSLWRAREFQQAVREINFNKRMLGMYPGKPIRRDIPMSRWEVSLRNWGHDPRKRSSIGRQKMEKWWATYFEPGLPSARSIM